MSPTAQPDNLDKLKKRYTEMSRYETDAWTQGFTVVAGLDEAGRGPLAGPVVAGICLLRAEDPILGLNDSKKLTPARREILYEEITRRCAGYAVGIVDEKTIDEINILNATKKAMLQAIQKLDIRPDLLLVDALQLNYPVRCIPIIKGDCLSVSIAAASILAKVTRDRLMEAYDAQYPGYGFSRHKGYGTAAHYDAINRLGICPIHRITFLTRILGQQQ